MLVRKQKSSPTRVDTGPDANALLCEARALRQLSGCWLRWSRTRLPMQETQVRSLGREDPPGEGSGNSLQYSGLGNPQGQSSLAGL